MRGNNKWLVVRYVAALLAGAALLASAGCVLSLALQVECVDQLSGECPVAPGR